MTGTANEEDAVDERGAIVESLTLMPMQRLLPIALTKERCLLTPLTTVAIRRSEAIEVDPPRTVVKLSDTCSFPSPKIVIVSAH